MLITSVSSHLTHPLANVDLYYTRCRFMVLQKVANVPVSHMYALALNGKYPDSGLYITTDGT